MAVSYGHGASMRSGDFIECLITSSSAWMFSNSYLNRVTNRIQKFKMPPISASHTFRVIPLDITDFAAFILHRNGGYCTCS